MLLRLAASSTAGNSSLARRTAPPTGVTSCQRAELRALCRARRSGASRDGCTTARTAYRPALRPSHRTGGVPSGCAIAHGVGPASCRTAVRLGQRTRCGAGVARRGLRGTRAESNTSPSGNDGSHGRLRLELRRYLVTHRRRSDRAVAEGREHESDRACETLMRRSGTPDTLPIPEARAPCRRPAL